ncbi:MSHA biogenesis protein MshG [Idiomarina tyrosinivorans]|uniref:MSHA biogenesis protein MshG n=1 Tax=Idiomarina tyrosinivorans TaxID=1445662 RepID=A0A432ZQG0_9GAMM|nr:type II secretion system F family protein [Idiomarina tyrosinivorans]RUO80139.1 MSHA biogenesis protein MshG [Idiomarina tyrosinivorans]
MAKFRYKARDPNGRLRNGDIDANDARQAAEQLVRRGLVPVDLVATRDKPSITAEQVWAKLTARPVKLDDLIIFCRQMYALTRSGVSLLRAIEGLADSAQNKQLSVTLRDVADQLEKGLSLSAAMARHARVFPRLIIAIVHVGENTGQLEQSFQQLAEYLEKEQDTRKRIKAATRYPSFVVIALVIAMFVLNLFVIPTFAKMFDQFGVDLPWATRVLIGTSTFFVSYWPLLLLALVAGVWGIRSYIVSPLGRVVWDRLKLRVPAVGSILERSMLARFARSFAVMVAAGVPLTQALSLVAEAVDNAWMERKILDMRRGIERGENLSRVSRQSDLFTPLVMQMVVVGEETGRLDDLLLEVAGYYEREVDYDLKTLTARIEPMLIAGVAVMVLILALGIFMPMWDMMSAYQGRG